ncbi:hypothetical protein ACVWZ6_002007 [Bradyrhizobium sp. GM6.1]
MFAVYLDQAHTFNRLTMNAANIWVLAGGLPYAIGVAVGMVLAAASGLALSIFIARSRRAGPEFILLVACVSLMLMPYLLPKMHERYFYAFELASIALACLNPRYVPFAVIAQVDGVLSYLAFENGIVLGVLPAALCNSLLVYYLVHDLWRGERGFRLSEACLARLHRVDRGIVLLSGHRRARFEHIAPVPARHGSRDSCGAAAPERVAWRLGRPGPVALILGDPRHRAISCQT